MRVEQDSDGLLSLIHLTVVVFAVHTILHLLRIFVETTMTVEGALAFYSRKRGCLGLCGADWTVVLPALVIAWLLVGVFVFSPAGPIQKAISGIAIFAGILSLIYSLYGHACGGPLIAHAEQHLRRFENMPVEASEGMRVKIGRARYCEQLRTLIEEAKNTVKKMEIQPAHAAEPSQSSGR